jgi:predicted nucleotidyltransferase
MPDSAFTPAEQRFLRELIARGVRFMIVGMSGALIQGARGATEDIDLWFEDPNDPRIAEAVRVAGGVWISGSFGMTPPRIGGDALSERFDVVVTMSGLGKFADEVGNVRDQEVDGIHLPVLSLERIAHSKRAAGRAKDRVALESIDDALAVLAGAPKK